MALPARAISGLQKLDNPDRCQSETKNQRVFIIGNPASGRGRASGQIKLLEKILAEDGNIVISKMTSAAGDVPRLLKDLPSDIDVLAVVGGDGTVNDVLNSLEIPTKLPIAVLPTGGANILARDLCLPRNANGTAKLIRNGKTRQIDIGLVGDQCRFSAVLSVGFDATVVKTVQQGRKGRLGMRGFLLPTLKIVFGFKAPKLTVSVDHLTPVNGAMVIVANTPTYAGFLHVADHAKCDSGHFDVVVLPRWGFLPVIRYFWAAYRKRLSKLPEVIYLTGGKVSIRSDVAADVEIDGEYFGTTPVDISVVPRAATFLVP